MTVSSFDPSDLQAGVAEKQVRELLAAAEVDNDTISLATTLQQSFASLITQQGWPDVAARFSDQELQDLVRIFTLGEMAFVGWQAGEKSAVIPLVRELKARSLFDKPFKQWIKSHTDNKFLPHGSLMDLL